MEVVVFDAYGTLFDVNAAARRLGREGAHRGLAGNWERIARDWREKQLEYTWLRTITADHIDFWQVTQAALDWALEAAGIANGDLRSALLDLYRELDAFDDVAPALDALRKAGAKTAILSNGTGDMLAAAVAHAGLEARFDGVLSADAVGAFKPSHKVYDLIGAQFDVQRRAVLFVSSNGWDAAGAAGYGFKAVWVNRAGQPPDRLAYAPDHICASLADLPDLMRT